MIKPSDYFKKLDLAHLDANTAQVIREKVLTLPNVDILSGTREFETLKAIIEENFPRAIGIEPIVIEPVVEFVVEPIVEIVPEVIIEEVIAPVIDTKQIEIDSITTQVSEMSDLIELMNEVVSENKDDLDSKDVLELYNETLVDLKDKLSKLSVVILDAIEEVKENIEEVKEIIKTEVIDTKGILTAPKKYTTEDSEEVLGYISDWNFGIDTKHNGNLAINYVIKEDGDKKYSVLTGILNKGIIYNTNKKLVNHKEYENEFETEKEALDFAYELSKDKETIEKYEKGGGVGEIKGKFLAEISVPYNFESVVKNEYDFVEFISKSLTKKWFGYGAWGVKVVKRLDEQNNITVEIYIPYRSINEYELIQFISKSLTKKWFGHGVWGIKVIEKYSIGGFIAGAALGVAGTILAQKKLAKNSIPVKKEKVKEDLVTKRDAEETWQDRVMYYIDNEGYDYCFNGYSEFKEVKDLPFHKLRKNYVKSYGALKSYVEKNLSDKYKDTVLGHIDKEGFDYTFDGYSTFKEIKDAKFHGLIKDYLSSKNALSKYIGYNKDTYKDGGSIGFIPMDLENDLAIISRRGGLGSVRDVIGILNAMIDSGLTDEDLKTPPTKTGHQYQKALDLKAREILDKIEGNIGEEYKDGLGGNMPYSAIRLMIENKTSMNKNLLKEFKPFRKYQKFENGGSINSLNDFSSSHIGNKVVWSYHIDDNESNPIVTKNGIIDSLSFDYTDETQPKFYKIKFENGRIINFGDKKHPLSKKYIYYDINELKEVDDFENGGVIKNIDKIKKSIGDTIYNHISSLNEEQLEKQLKELKVELNKEYFDSNGKSERYKKLNDEMYYILYRLERASDDFRFNVGEKVRIADEPKSSQKPYEVIGHENYNETYGWETIIKSGDEKLTMFENRLDKYNSDSDKDENIAKIRFNDHWKKVQLFIDGSLYGEFDTYQDAIQDAKNNNSKVTVEDDVTMLTISTQNPLSNQLSKITGDGWNSIDYQNLSGGNEVTTVRPFKHIATGKIFEVVKK